MPGNISTVPVGLLGLLGIKNDGEYPGSLANFIQPQLDMLPWLAANYARELITEAVTAFSTTGLKPGSTGLLLVPPGQVWLAHGINSQAVITATDMLVGAVSITRGFGAQRQQVNRAPLDRTSATDAAQAAAFQSVLPGPLLLFPGDDVELFVADLTTAGTIAAFVAAVVTRFQL
jgi:hypothetical protein